MSLKDSDLHSEMQIGIMKKQNERSRHDERKANEKIIIWVVGFLILAAALAFLPNIELVSLLVLIYTLVLGRKTLVIIYTFAILEGIFYGFGIWWVMYLYVWTILYAVVRMMRKNKNIILWAAVNGIFGLLFGAFCALPYAAAGALCCKTTGGNRDRKE